MSTSQGHLHKYEDLKGKIYNCNANVYFNKKYLRKNIIPNFAKIKIPNTSPASQFTQGNEVVLDYKFVYFVNLHLPLMTYFVKKIKLNISGPTFEIFIFRILKAVALGSGD